MKIHIGGDQLIRERFSWAKILRIGNYDPAARFAYLGPITSEFFHLKMNYLEQMFFDSLWNDKGLMQVSTLKCEKEGILRHSVENNMMKAYDANKDFTESFENAYMAEATMQYFGMEETNDMPTRNAPPVHTCSGLSAGSTASHHKMSPVRVLAERC